VAFSVRHNLEVAAETGAFANELRATGGAANSPLWMQIKSDITAKPIAVPYSDSSTTLGAAMLAGVAVGIYNNFEEAVQSTVSIKQSYEPNLANEHTYSENYALYLSIYERLRK
jgi:xylulokinase